jgi:hypothetical protein
MRFRPLNEILVTATVGFALAAAPAAAEVSSVDAYSGQAAVLGAPRAHHHKAHGSNGGSGGKPGVGTHTGVTGSGSSQGPPSSPSGGSGSSHGGTAGKGTAVTGQAGSVAGQPAALASEADGSLSLSWLDVVVLAAILVCLLGTGVLIRRLGRQPE